MHHIRPGGRVRSPSAMSSRTGKAAPAPGPAPASPSPAGPVGRGRPNVLFFPELRGGRLRVPCLSLHPPSSSKYSAGAHYVRSSGPASTGGGVTAATKPAVSFALPTSRRSANPADLNPQASPQSTCSICLHRHHPRSATAFLCLCHLIASRNPPGPLQLLPLKLE